MILKLDFTISTLQKLYSVLLGHKYLCMNISDFAKQKDEILTCGIRHDVDKNVQKALDVACLEKEMGIYSTFFFRYKKTFDKNIIKKVLKLGHEIGYHYEVLSKARGDYKKAIKLFESELAEFRKITPLRCIVAHGAPLSRWDNKKIWQYYDFHNFGIETEAYISFDFKKIHYLTDTGRRWGGCMGNLRDRVCSKQDLFFQNTYQIIQAVEKDVFPQKIIINIHPQRWHDNLLECFMEFAYQHIKNIAKLAISFRYKNDK
jgi:hypothetical protein